MAGDVGLDFSPVFVKGREVTQTPGQQAWKSLQDGLTGRLMEEVGRIAFAGWALSRCFLEGHLLI